MRGVAVALGGLIGLVGGYYLGAIAACDYLWPGSNLCGLFGVFLTAPLGLACGMATGRWLTRRTGPDRGP